MTSTEFKPKGVHLIGQFGKQGSGRADLTLPSGIHATPQGQLFIVDCGNARIQVGVIQLKHVQKFFFSVGNETVNEVIIEFQL